MAKKQQKNDLSYRINEEIWVKDNVRVIGEPYNGKVMHISEARKIASSEGLDLVEVNRSIEPPIVRICDYSKFLYEAKKAMKKAQQKPKPLKEIQLSVSIAKHDLETKVGMAKRFIEGGFKVKVILFMKGREVSRREENKKSIFEFLTMVEDFASIETMPKDEGNRTIVIIKPK